MTAALTASKADKVEMAKKTEEGESPRNRELWKLVLWKGAMQTLCECCAV